MHIVTKVLAVFAAVLSILLAGLSIAYTSNADRLVRDIKGERDRAAKSEAQVAEINAQADGERQSAQTKIAALESAIAELTGSLSKTRSENASLLAEVNELKQSAATHSSQIDQFTAVVQTYADLNKAQSAELATLRDRELAYAKKEIELSDRINDLSGQLEVSLETNRSLQEQLIQIRDQVGRGTATASGAQGGTPAIVGTFLRAPTNLRARVTDVRKEADGTVLVSIDAGLTDQLRERMKLSLQRDRFIGHVILTKVDDRTSVGRLELINPGVPTEIQVGDLVVATAL